VDSAVRLKSSLCDEHTGGQSTIDVDLVYVGARLGAGEALGQRRAVVDEVGSLRRVRGAEGGLTYLFRDGTVGISANMHEFQALFERTGEVEDGTARGGVVRGPRWARVARTLEIKLDIEEIGVGRVICVEAEARDACAGLVTRGTQLIVGVGDGVGGAVDLDGCGGAGRRVDGQEGVGSGLWCVRRCDVRDRARFGGLLLPVPGHREVGLDCSVRLGSPERALLVRPPLYGDEDAGIGEEERQEDGEDGGETAAADGGLEVVW
jgi:hypothetical protein